MRRLPRCDRVNHGYRHGASCISSSSIQSKSDFYADLYVYWPAISQGGLEAPLLHGFDCLRIQSKPEPANHANVARMSLCIDNQAQRMQVP
jgi:hypothetical protein